MDTWDEWQKAYKYGTIVIWPPDKIRKIVNWQRSYYDPVSQSYCEAHITVTQPLARELNAREWSQITDLIQEFWSFEVQYGPLNSFLPYPCIWYEIHPKNNILEIRNSLHQIGFFSLEMNHPKNFIPHMTITEGLSGPEVNENLLERLRDESSNGSFTCDNLVYIFPNEHFRFEVVKLLVLKAVN